MNTLWVLLIAGQILNAGNMNYQQENGYYEINHYLYSKHPSKKKVYCIKALETGGIWLGTKIWPEYKKNILTGTNGIVWGVMLMDHGAGIKLEYRF